MEKLEQTVRSNWLVRQAYVNLLRSHMPRKSDAHRIYDIVSNKIFTHRALQNYYLTVDRQPYFKQATRKAMVNYEIFQGCMLGECPYKANQPTGYAEIGFITLARM